MSTADNGNMNSSQQGSGFPAALRNLEVSGTTRSTSSRHGGPCPLSTVLACPQCHEPFTNRQHNYTDMTLPLVLTCAHSMCLACVARNIQQALTGSTVNSSSKIDGEPKFFFKCAICKCPQTAKVLSSSNLLNPQRELEILSVYPLDIYTIGRLALPHCVPRTMIVDESLECVDVVCKNPADRGREEFAIGSGKPSCSLCEQQNADVRCSTCKEDYCHCCLPDHKPACVAHGKPVTYHYLDHTGNIVDVPRSCPEHNVPMVYTNLDSGAALCVDCVDQSPNASREVDVRAQNTAAMVTFSSTTALMKEISQCTEACLQDIMQGFEFLQMKCFSDMSSFDLFFSRLIASLTRLSISMADKLRNVDAKRLRFLEQLLKSLQVQLLRLRHLEKKMQFYILEGASLAVDLGGELEDILSELRQFGIWHSEGVYQGRLDQEKLENTVILSDLPGNLRVLLNYIESVVDVPESEIRNQLDCLNVEQCTEVVDEDTEQAMFKLKTF